MSDLIQTITDDRVLTIRLNRPEKRNALNAELVSALKSALDSAEERDDLRVIVLTGAGSAFSAGADLSSLRVMREAGPMENQQDSRHLAELFRQDEPEGKSVSDLVAETGLTEHQVRHKLRSLVETGQVECAGRKQGKRMDGVTCQLPVYRWIGDKGEDL